MRRHLFAPLALALLFGGCSLAPELTITPPPLPESNATITLPDHWWEGFNDPQLNALVEEALLHNDDLRQAVNNVVLARATLGLESAAKRRRR